MLCSVLPLLSSIITYIYDHVKNPGQVINAELNGWGNFVINLPYLANIIIFVAVVGAIGIPCGKFRVWCDWRKSSKIIRFGFIVSFILPMIPAFVPLKYLAKDPPPPDSENPTDIFRNILGIFLSDQDPAQLNNANPETLEWIRLQMEVALSNFIKFLPALISFPASLSGASLRIKGLLPKSSLSSWILTVAGPFLSLVILTAAMLIIQIYSNVLLSLGVLCLVGGPWLNVFRRGLYTKAPHKEVNKKIDCNQRLSLILKLTGLILVIIWAITDLRFMQVDMWQVLKLIKLVLEMWGRILGSTVVFTDVLLRMTVTNWGVEKSLRTKPIDDFYESIERGIWKKIELEDDVEWAPRIPGECGDMEGIDGER